MPSPAHRLTQLPPYIFSEISRHVQSLTDAGQDIIRLDVGSPDMPPPAHVVEALAISAAEPNNHGYSGYRGIAAFREAIARYYQRRFGVTLHPEQEVLPLLGSKEGIVNLALAYIDRGDCVLVPALGYPAYAMGAVLAGGTAEVVPLDENYHINFDEIPRSVATKAKLLWMNYPNNPTGAIADRDFYRRAIEFGMANDLLIASDNPYVEVTFDGVRAGSLLEAADAKQHAVEFFSFSKSHNMAGWRLGAAVGKTDALKQLLNIKSNVDSGHFKAIYEAGIVALESTPESWIDNRNLIYQRRRDQIVDALPFMGLAGDSPKGAMYVWAQVIDGDGDTYTHQAREQAGVSIAPGSAYGEAGKRYVRLSVGVPDDVLTTALNRLKQWYSNR